jgi:hypothetical protein
MALQPFTDNYQDNSSESGFQFTFYCDVCREGYKTSFIESKTYKKAGLLRGLGKAISIGGSLLGTSAGYNVERGADILSERYHGMSPEWRKEYEAAFALAQNEAKEHFKRCPKCTKWVCENDFNEQQGLCTVCSPRENVEVAAAKAEKMIQDIKEKAQQTQVFTGAIESKQTLCPQCGKPAGEGKFCNNCGAPMSLIKCPKCGAKSQIGTKFCGECGNKIA